MQRTHPRSRLSRFGLGRASSVWQRIVIGAGLTGVIGGIVLVVIPLPTQALGTCGAGSSSSSAVEVKLNPSIVNAGSGTGATAPSQQEHKAWEATCQGVADSRIELSVIIVGASVVGALFVAHLISGVEAPAGAPAGRAPSPSPPPAGWYADPAGGDASRWWDGERWTEHVNRRDEP
jgi:hypothetical protein